MIEQANVTSPHSTTFATATAPEHFAPFVLFAKPPIESVAIVTFSKGRRHHVEETLPRMLSQQWKNDGRFWVVVVDYGCPDGTGEWCEKNPKWSGRDRERLRVVKVLDASRDELNRSHARNVGGVFAAKQLGADAIAFLDADTLLEPTWLLDAAANLEKNGGVAIVTPKWNQQTDRFQRGVGCCLVRADVFQQVRGYDEALQGWGWEDSDFHNRCTAEGGNGLTDGTKIRMKPHPVSERVRFHATKDRVQSKRENVAKTKARDESGLPANPDGFGEANIEVVVPLPVKEQRFPTALSSSSARAKTATNKKPPASHSVRMSKETKAATFPTSTDSHKMDILMQIRNHAIADAPEATTLSTPAVLCVLLHYMQPRQVEMVIGSIRSQTHQCKIVVVDNHPAPENGQPDTFALSDAILGQVDDVWRFSEDYGAPAQFAPAYAQHGCKYVYFHRENMLPGPKAIEYLVSVAESLDGQFATIGQMGRRFSVRNSRRKKMTSSLAQQWFCPADDQPQSPSRLLSVDVTRRANLVRADLMPSVLQFAWELHSRNVNVSEHIGLNRHADFLLCMGIQRATGYPSYITPLTEPDAMVQRRVLRETAPGVNQHESIEQQRFIREAVGAGWASLWRDYDDA